MWLIAEYRPVALFSLKSSLATSTGAKTLLVPTPFAVRTALLDAAIRTRGLTSGEAVFAWLKSLDIALLPPERVVVTNLFVKVQKPSRDGSRAMQKTIAFREYAYLEGALGLAFEGEPDPLDELEGLLRQVNYLGKRGSFFQLHRLPTRRESLPDGYCPLDGAYLSGGRINGRGPKSFSLGVVQILDDWGPGLTFEKVNVYTKAHIVLGKDRVQKIIVLPYRPVRSSRGFTLYERIAGTPG